MSPPPSVLFDPYCLYGHHEFDFTQPLLLDDFNKEFYQGYHDVIPRGPGFRARQALYRVFGCLIRYTYGMKEYGPRINQSMKTVLNMVSDQQR